MEWIPPPTGRRGRQQSFSDAAIQACLTMKVLFGMPLRQTTGFVQSLLQLVGLGWSVPDFSTLCRRQRTLNVSIPYRGGTGPLNLCKRRAIALVDVVFSFFEKEPSRYGGFLWMIRYKIT